MENIDPIFQTLGVGGMVAAAAVAGLTEVQIDELFVSGSQL
jgi:hypothetical protein